MTTMTPSKEELETRVKHFANTVFAIGAGLIMLSASLLQGLVVARIGESGADITFITATILILMLASKRPSFALYELRRQCAKYGHTMPEGSRVCNRCLQTIPDPDRPD